MKVGTFVLGVAVISSVAFAERQPFERYKSVVDRQMFGPPPEGFDPTKHPSEAVTSRAQQKADAEKEREQQKLKSAIRFSMINMTPAGETAVGFTDSSDPKSPRHLYLKVGETGGGWTVKEADAAQSTMTIVNAEGIEVSLKIGGDSGKGGGKTASAAANAPVSKPAGVSVGSLRARRNQRRAEEQARMADIEKKMQEREAAFEKRQQEAQQAREAEKAREAEEKAREAEEKARQDAQREAQREEQRKQLLQIQEELRKAREEKTQNEKSDSDEDH